MRQSSAGRGLAVTSCLCALSSVHGRTQHRSSASPLVSSVSAAVAGVMQRSASPLLHPPPRSPVSSSTRNLDSRLLSISTSCVSSENHHRINQHNPSQVTCPDQLLPLLLSWLPATQTDLRSDQRGRGVRKRLLTDETRSGADQTRSSGVSSRRRFHPESADSALIEKVSFPFVLLLFLLLL